MEQPHQNATTFLLVRHAQTVWNREQRHTGSTEVELSEKAHSQIMRLTKKIISRPVTAIYSSPLSRCQITIRQSAEILELPIRTREDLLERNLGEWEGKSPVELMPTHPGYQFPQSAYNGDFRIPKAEPLEHLEHRIRGFLNELHATHPGSTIAISTHSGVIWTIINTIATNPPSEFFWPSNCSISTVVSEGNHFTFENFEA